MLSLFHPKTLCLWWLTLSYCISYIACKKLILYAITNANQGILAGQTLAVDHINNDTTLLPEYNIELRALYAYRSPVTALKLAIDLISMPLVPDNSSIVIPIVLGCPYSSESITTAPALNAFNFGLLSSGATSIALSETSLFSYFYRTIPDDGMQAAGIIELCKAFEWKTIGIMHTSDAYGMNLAISLLELSTLYDIDANAISFQHTDIVSIDAAANSIKDLNVFIVILIAFGPDLVDIYQILKNKNMYGYPYYYVGVDAWMDVIYTRKSDIAPHVVGSVGTVPWFPGVLSANDFEDDLQIIYNTSLFYKDLLSKAWSSEYTKNSTLFEHPTPGTFSTYAWDSTYTVARAMHTFDEQYSLQRLLDGTLNASMVLDALDHILTHDMQFLGATGNVTFDENGNRKNGIYAFANVLPNGSIQYFGYFYGGDFHIHKDDIVWPSDFVDKGLIPRSSKLIKHEAIAINHVLFIIICAVMGVSSITVLFFIGSTVYFHEEPILVAGSWKLNLFVCFGCLLTYVAVFLFGINTHNYDSFICNTRIWLLCISFTMIFIPLFLKTYRLERIFRSFKIQTIPDSQLIIGILVCVLIDCVILTIFTAIEPLQRQYINGSTLAIDELQEIQYKFAVCTHSYTMVLYLVLGIWKALQLGFGVYVALAVSRIGIKQLTKFDETGQQIGAIVFTVCIIAMIVPYLLVSSGDDNISVKYGMVSMCILMTCNVSLIANIFPRIRAICLAKIKHNEDFLKEFEDTFEDIVTKMIKKQIRNFRATSRRRLSLSSITDRTPHKPLKNHDPDVL